MIARAHRFHGLNSLRTVYNRGQTVRGSLTATKFMINPRRRSYRAAVVVSRKVHKSAVVRNRIRRRIYEIIRALEPDISEPYDIVITVFSEQIATMPDEELRGTIREQFTRGTIINVVNAGSITPTDGSKHGQGMV